MINLDGKKALVTGASRGIGKAIAIRLATEGVSVGVNYNASEQEAAKVVDEIQSLGGNAIILKGSVADSLEVQSLIQAAEDKLGGLDILVNNAGVLGAIADTQSLTEEDYLQVCAVNQHSVFFGMKSVLPSLVVRGGGSIVNISSIAGQRYIGKPQVGYAAAKAGLMQLTKTSAVIHAKDNVRVNCVVPGLMHTPMLNRMAQKYAGGDLAGFIAKRNAMVPMRRMGDAQDVANAVLFLAADESSYVTATEIVVDGGITAATQGDLP